MCNIYTVKPVLSIHIKQDIFLAFQTGDCLSLHESIAESPGELSALLSFSNKQPPVYSNLHVTRMDGSLKQVNLYLDNQVSVAVQAGLCLGW